MKCSLTIIAASPEMTMLQFVSGTFRVDDATAYPWDRNKSLTTLPVWLPWW